MALFDIPGWSVASEPVAESSKKRKRRSQDSSTSTSEKLLAAEVNLERLFKRVKRNSEPPPAKPPSKASPDSKKTSTSKQNSPPASPSVHPDESSPSQHISKKQQRKLREHEAKKLSISRPKRLQSQAALERAASPAALPATAAAPASAGKNKPKLKESAFTFSSPLAPSKASDRGARVSSGTAVESEPSPSDAGLTDMQKSMKQRLTGARFRLINESLYKTDGAKAHRIMRDDPQVFADYHTGFRHQVQSWPTNPVDIYIKALSQYSKDMLMADLGCGDAKLGRALAARGIRVLSFDLVSDGAFVVEADICEHVPLPGSDVPADGPPSQGEGHVIDVVVCALSLMGTNWPTCIREAWRILRPGGELKIAEVTSRFTNVKQFIALVTSIGFRLKSKDDANTHFMLFEFEKVARKAKSSKDWQDILNKGSILKPCEYKRR